MKKSAFIKRGGTLMAGGMFFSFCSTPEKKSMSAVTPETRWNWAGNLQYSAENFYQPVSIEQLQELVRQCENLRTLGTAHCFNKIADSKSNQISVRTLDTIKSLDQIGMTATIGAGASYGQICTELYQKGYALHKPGLKQYLYS